MNKGLFIAATGQNIGKTTACLGLFSGLCKRFSHVTFMKPVGQEHLEVEKELFVDKDVTLFKSFFSLQDAYSNLSPVLVPRGFTKRFLDKKIIQNDLLGKIKTAYSSLATDNQFILVEGTGHVGVGSIIGLNNAYIAAQLGLPMVFVIPGGLGSSFDELFLNIALCDKYKVPVKGVIINRLLPEKQKEIVHYMQKALFPWKIPILGAIPYSAPLSAPSMGDFELLFKESMLTGEKNRYRHFSHIRLVSSSVSHFREHMHKEQLIITSASREDIILGLIARSWDEKISTGENMLTGLILTGETPPREYLIQELKKAHIPMLYTPQRSYQTMQTIHDYTAKIRMGDTEKIQKAIDLVEEHIDFSVLEEIIGAPAIFQMH